MFRSKEDFPRGIAHNALSNGSIIKGNMHAEGDLRIDGLVEGNIECNGKIVLGPQGEIRGNIRCESAEIMGKMAGDVNVQGNVSLKRAAHFQGRMTVESLDIEPGAVFNGTCKMDSAPEK